MGVLNPNDAVTKGIVGLGSGTAPVTKSTAAITGNPTTPIFTVTGDVLITHLWAEVETALSTDSGTYAVQHNPTTGDTRTLVTATDLGTSDTAVGSAVGLTRGTTAAPAFLRGGTSELGAIVNTGQVEFVGAASANGSLLFKCRWVPLTAGATLVAA